MKLESTLHQLDLLTELADRTYILEFNLDSPIEFQQKLELFWEFTAWVKQQNMKRNYRWYGYDFAWAFIRIEDALTAKLRFG
jgi:hypothetical protein